jgi:hypothetical protein
MNSYLINYLIRSSVNAQFENQMFNVQVTKQVFTFTESASNVNANELSENGLIYWFGTKGKTQPYMNPHDSGFVTVTMRSNHKGGPQRITERLVSKAVPNYSKNQRNSWAMIDLGPTRKLSLTAYSLRHGGSSKPTNIMRVLS